ncbi:MAG TPA: acyl-CoA reductase [Tenuifilaceae bacterium]|nr:acyl-CoA reductase [Tenuifilaceae bacterium]
MKEKNMDASERVLAFVKLGNSILHPCNNHSANRLWDKVFKAHNHNPWFTPDFCKLAIESIANQWLNESVLTGFINKYPVEHFSKTESKRIAVIMAGNVPLVGFHDFLCVLITGNTFIGKLSSKDGGLMQAIVDLVIDIEPGFKDKILLTEHKLPEFDAIIATGSNNSARYFEFYFGFYPNIIRSNRNSIAVLDGTESANELSALADDVFMYFGLGCRSVSLVFVPERYDFSNLFNAFIKYQNLKYHNKYANNFEYQRAMLLMNNLEHFDNGFILLKQSESLSSPVAILHYCYYKNFSEVNRYLEMNNDLIQCVSSDSKLVQNTIPLGSCQKPSINDFADGIDVVEFLHSVHKSPESR